MIRGMLGLGREAMLEVSGRVTAKFFQGRAHRGFVSSAMSKGAIRVINSLSPCLLEATIGQGGALAADLFAWDKLLITLASGAVGCLEEKES